MRFHNRAIDQVQTVARFCRESIENTLPHPSPRPAVEPIVRTRVRAIAFGQIAPRDPGPQHVKYCIYDPSIVRARALPTLRHQRLKNRPFLIAEIESHDPPPPAVNHDPCCFSVNYAGTDPSRVGGPAPAAALSMRVRLWPTESRPRLLRVCRIGANRDDDGAVVAQRLGHHFGMAVQPAQTGAIGGVEDEVEGYPPRREPPLDFGGQTLEAL